MGKEEELQMLDEDEGGTKPSRSLIAQEILDLQRIIAKHLSQRERLPQPLFWSLFNDKVKRLKALRAQQRALSELFDP